MSFDLDKLQAVAELGDVIRHHNEALDRLTAFRKARPYMVMPNLMKVVEENLKENLQVLYKEFNNLHKPAEQQTRYICNDCKMAFLVKLPGGICDECRVKRATKPRDYVLQPHTDAEDDDLPRESDMIPGAGEGELAEAEKNEEIAADVENATTGDKPPVDVEEVVASESRPAESPESRDDGMSEDFQKFMAIAGGAATSGSENNAAQAPGTAGDKTEAGESEASSSAEAADETTDDDSDTRQKS